MLYINNKIKATDVNLITKDAFAEFKKLVDYIYSRITDCAKNYEYNVNIDVSCYKISDKIFKQLYKQLTRDGYVVDSDVKSKTFRIDWEYPIKIFDYIYDEIEKSVQFTNVVKIEINKILLDKYKEIIEDIEKEYEIKFNYTITDNF